MAQEQDFEGEDFEEEFILDENEIQEELLVGQEPEEEEGEGGEPQGDMMDMDQEGQQMEFKDDSIQGFFEHQRKILAGEHCFYY